MTPRDPPDWYSREPKKPPPAHGIKLKKAGTTWWGERWIEALQQVLRGDAGRLARGRTYARAGRTHDLILQDGKVTAKVTGSRATPYEITLALAQLSEATWSEAIVGMAGRAQFAAELLGGQMPRHIDEVFRAAGSSLFPLRRSELSTSCSCPDWGDPCKHVAATHYVLGEALDRDPFLLFELRGRSKEAVLDALRAARTGTVGSGAESAADVMARADERHGEPQTVALNDLRDADYDRVPDQLPALQFSFDAPKNPGALLRQLGVPSAWTSKDSPADALTPIVRAAAETARRIALEEQVPEASAEQARAALPSEEGKVRSATKRRPALPPAAKSTTKKPRRKQR